MVRKKKGSGTKLSQQKESLGLENFIIRTRNQSKRQDQSNMAGPNKEISQDQRENVDSNAINCGQGMLLPEEVSEESLNLIHEDESSEAEKTLNSHTSLTKQKEKGMVAGMVEQINNSPTVSPVEFGQSAVIKPPPSRGRKLMLQQSTLEKESINMSKVGEKDTTIKL